LVPAAPFIKYDPKDAIVVIAGFMYGPLPALAIAFVASFVEMVTVGESGIIGLVMSMIATVGFVVPASVIYKRKHDIPGAVIGLAVGSVCMICVMLLWNYIIMPLYTEGVTRDVVVGMMLPALLPFNALKCGVNASIAMFLYKPLVTALRKSGLLQKEETNTAKGKINLGVVAVSLFMLVSLVLVIVIWNR
jgi:riboflavin transporter FmnP